MTNVQHDQGIWNCGYIIKMTSWVQSYAEFIVRANLYSILCWILLWEMTLIPRNWRWGQGHQIIPLSSLLSVFLEPRKAQSTQKALNKNACWMGGWTNKKLATLTYSFLNRDFVIVSDWVLPKEVKLDHIFLAIQLRVQIDMLHAQRAATHSVCCFSFLFLIACSQSKLSQEEKVREDIKISMNEETSVSQDLYETKIRIPSILFGDRALFCKTWEFWILHCCFFLYKMKYEASWEY